MGAEGPVAEGTLEGATAEGVTEGTAGEPVGPAEEGAAVTVIRVVVVDGPAVPTALDAPGAKIPPGLLGIAEGVAEGVAETLGYADADAVALGVAVDC